MWESRRIINESFCRSYLWYASVCVLNLHEDFGDVDYIDSCGNYITTIASALTLVVISEL